MKKTLLFMSLSFFSALTVKAQNVGIGTTTPSTNAILHVDADPTAPKGLLIPRFTAAQITAFVPANTENGMLVYNTDDDMIYRWDGAAWAALGGSSGWDLAGNAATSTDFIGTTNTNPLTVKVNNQVKAVFSSGVISIGGVNSGTGLLSVSIGTANTVNSNRSVAIGNYTQPAHLGTVVMGDYSTTTNTSSSATNEFTSRFAGGYRFFTDASLTETQAVYFNSGGNVGFGTSTPVGPFHVAVDKDATKDSLFVVDNAGRVGVGTVPSGTYKIEINGNIGTAGINEMSDARWKKDVNTINSALDMIMNMRGVTYHWRTDEFPNKNFSESKQIGFIAQEVEEVAPELVGTDANGYKSVEYSKVTAILTNAIQEQQDIINAQHMEIVKLQAQIEEIRKELLKTETAFQQK